MTNKEEQQCLTGLGVMYSTDTNGMSQTSPSSEASSPSTEEVSLSKEGVEFAGSIACGRSVKNQSDSSKCEESTPSPTNSTPRKKHSQREILLRYPSGLPLLWTTNIPTEQPMITIPPEKMVDLSIHATDTVEGASQSPFTPVQKDGGIVEEADRKKLWKWKSAITQYAGEYAVRTYFKLSTDIQYSKRTKLLSVGDKRIIVKASSDYHGDLVIPSWDRRLGADIFILTTRFGHDEKVLIRGWIPANYLHTVASSFSKKRARGYTMEFFSVCQEELFPIDLLEKECGVKEDTFGF